MSLLFDSKFEKKQLARFDKYFIKDSLLKDFLSYLDESDNHHIKNKIDTVIANWLNRLENWKSLNFDGLLSYYLKQEEVDFTHKERIMTNLAFLKTQGIAPYTYQMILGKRLPDDKTATETISEGFLYGALFTLSGGLLGIGSAIYNTISNSNESDNLKVYCQKVLISLNEKEYLQIIDYIKTLYWPWQRGKLIDEFTKLYGLLIMEIEMEMEKKGSLKALESAL